MPNSFKYSPGGSGPGTLKKGDFLIGNGTADYGVTFYNGIDPPSGGYTLYLNKGSNGPSIVTPSNESELIYWTLAISGNLYSNEQECLSWFLTQNDKVCVNKNYSGIVTDGMVLCLDAGYTPSYPKGGTSWYDVSLSSYRASLFNLPAFNSGGWLTFDGTDDYAEVNNTNLNSFSTITVEIFANVANFSIEGMFFGFTSYDVYVRTVSGFGYNTGAGDVYGISSADITSLGLQGSWVYYTFVMVNNTSLSSNPYTNNKIYINGEEKTLTQRNGSQSPATRAFASKMTINGWNNSSQFYRVPMSYATLKIYNRALTPYEVYQNFTTTLNPTIVIDGLRLITSWINLANLTERTANAVQAPDGTMTATLFERISVSIVGHAQVRQSFPVVDLLPSTKYRISFWAKRIYLTQYLDFDLADFPSQRITLTDDWKLYSFSLTTNSTFPNGKFVDIGSTPTSSGSQLGEKYSIWSLQISLAK